MAIKKVLVLFKTHLDVGFTDFSKSVITKYMDSFIPNSLRVAQELRKKNGDARLVWTTGSWLIHEYLRTHSGTEAEAVVTAIENGDLCWHGLPFTTHTELMSGSLFEYGLSLSKELDQRFGKKTIAAKMTDVPGHTKAIVPYLKHAGIEFLHIGVNPASAVPCVPPLFRWKAENGDMINVMYHNDYGEFSEIGDTGVAIYFAHTGDNLGVQSSDVIVDLFHKLREKLPGVEITAANLDDVALIVRGIEDTLPVVTEEIGDSWIHGVGTDPKKVSQFRALSRFYEQMPEGEEKAALARGLIMVPEHTWGLDEKTHLKDHEYYDRDSFHAVRGNENFQKMERSWQEQRNFLSEAVAHLGSANREKAMALMSQADRAEASVTGGVCVLPGTILGLGEYRMKFSARGELVHLERKGKLLADEEHRLLRLVYEQFCVEDYERFRSQYLRLDKRWAIEDFTKPGMEHGSQEYLRFEPERADVYLLDEKVIVRYAFPQDAYEKYGCPKSFDLVVSVGEDGGLVFDLAWFGKQANRVAEAIWVGFKPLGVNKHIRKLGMNIDPTNVVDNGQCRLHATDFGVVYEGFCIESADAALVAPGDPSLLNFVNEVPGDGDGVYFNLYNNVWGTNFPMWYEEDARFRFLLRMK